MFCIMNDRTITKSKLKSPRLKTTFTAAEDSTSAERYLGISDPTGRRIGMQHADALANLGCAQQPQLVTYFYPPPQVSQLLLSNGMGVATL